MFDSISGRGPLAPRTTVVGAMIACTLWSASVTYLWSNELRLVYRRPHVGRLVSDEGVVGLRTTDGIALDAVSLIHEGPARDWILFCASSRGSIHAGGRAELEWLHQAGYNVVGFDYRGYGRNAGTPSEAGLYEDALTAYRHIARELQVQPHRIILAGRSLGSAVAVDLATRVPSAGLLLLSAIDSVPAVGSRIYFWAPVRLLASQQFDSLAKAPRVSAPVLQVHATNDPMVPLRAARALFRQFPGRKAMLELRGGHNDVGIGEDDALRRALAHFWPSPQP
jgi:alpha-beta hydrolase superfamily lysophospholipase